MCARARVGPCHVLKVCVRIPHARAHGASHVVMTWTRARLNAWKLRTQTHQVRALAPGSCCNRVLARVWCRHIDYGHETQRYSRAYLAISLHSKHARGTPTMHHVCCQRKIMDATLMGLASSGCVVQCAREQQ